MKVFLLATLWLLAASSSLAQLPYTPEQVVAYAKSIDVQTLDPALPSQRLEDWLQTGPPHAQTLVWLVEDTCELKPVANEDYPLCVLVRLRPNGQWGEFLVQIGTLETGIVGTPRIFGGGVGAEEDDRVTTGYSEHLSDLPGLLDQPAVTGGVDKLYREIAAHHPIGIPKGAEMATIQPFLSKRLTEQLHMARMCQQDYFRHHHPTIGGAPTPAWLRSGLFSGGGKRALPVDPFLWSKERQEDGSFLVEVHLWPSVYLPNGVWRVAARVIFEDGQFVVDDVRMFDTFSVDSPSHLLSDTFVGCDGPHWIGIAAMKE
jgi:hypothetical protein